MTETKEKAKSAASRNGSTPDRRINLKYSSVGTETPAFLGISQADLHVPGSGSKTSRSNDMWLDLIDKCIAHPGEWMNRKFYYDDPEQNFTMGMQCGWFNTNGEVDGETASHVVPTRIREVCKTYNVTFDVQYTRRPVASDIPIRGAVMHVAFIRAVKNTGAPTTDSLMAHSGPESDRAGRRPANERP